MRVVNSSVFGLGQKVSNLKQAVSLIGIKTLKMFVLGFSLPANLTTGATTEVLGRYWQHALFKAVAARDIAESFYEQPGDEAFLGGLLQNLGMLVLVQDLGSVYEKFLLNIWSENGDLADAECEVLGFEHKSLSSRLLEHWNLPAALVEAVGLPQDPERLVALEPPHQALPQVLHLAELVAAFLIDQNPRQLNTLLDIGQRYRGMTMAQLETLMASLEQKAPQLADILSLELPNGTSYSTVLINAYQRLVDSLDDATAELLAGTPRPQELLAARYTAASGAGHERATTRPGPNRQYVRQTSSTTTVATSRDPGHFPVACDDATATRRWTASTAPIETVPSTREAIVGRISVVVSRCRQSRSALSLLLVELDELDKAVFFCGIDGVPRITKRLESTLGSIVDVEGAVCQIDESRFAILLDGCDRRRAVALAWRVVDCVRSWKFPALTAAQAGMTVSIGLASLTMPPRNFPPEELLTAAERCLSGVQLSGGNGVKSIDIY
jgi:HD-like signal output (HDOD) protein/GGDEF domain-containing protein